MLAPHWVERTPKEEHLVDVTELDWLRADRMDWQTD